MENPNNIANLNAVQEKIAKEIQQEMINTFHQGKLQSVKTSISNLSIGNLNQVLQRVIKQIGTVQSVPAFEQLIVSFQALKTNIENLIQYKSGKLLLDEQSVENLIKNTDMLWQELSYQEEQVPNNDERGKFFEAGITLADAVEDEICNVVPIQIVSKYLTLDRAKKWTAGDKMVNLNVDDIKITMEGQTGKSEYVVENKQRYFDFGERGSAKLSVNALANYKQKVDAELTLPSPKDNPLIPEETFKISAKNWSSTFFHSFGSTSIAYAILRSNGNNVDELLSYGLKAGWSKNNVPSIHQWAKIMIILDHVVGLGQGKETAADTLVINNRSKNCIEVYSTAEILDRIVNNMDKIKINGYSNVQKIDLEYSEHLSPQNYANKILAHLRGITVSISTGRDLF